MQERKSFCAISVSVLVVENRLFPFVISSCHRLTPPSLPLAKPWLDELEQARSGDLFSSASLLRRELPERSPKIVPPGPLNVGLVAAEQKIPSAFIQRVRTKMPDKKTGFSEPLKFRAYRVENRSNSYSSPRGLSRVLDASYRPIIFPEGAACWLRTFRTQDSFSATWGKPENSWTTTP